MTRKTSAYARKMRREPTKGTFNGAAWLNTLQRCRPYTAEPIPGAFNPDGGQTLTAAEGAALRVRAAFDVIRNGQARKDDTEPHDLLAHAVGVARLRAEEIAGPSPAQNPMLPILDDAAAALLRMAARWRRAGAWGLDGPGLVAVGDALQVYEEILMNSSPAQMAAAADRRARIVEQQATAAERKRA